MTTPDPTTDSIFDSLLKDLGPDPDTELSEEELNQIAGDQSVSSATTIEDAADPAEPEAQPVAELQPEPEAQPVPEKPKRGRPRKVVEATTAEKPAQPALAGTIVGVDLSPQTLAEMEAGRAAISRGRLG